MKIVPAARLAVQAAVSVICLLAMTRELLAQKRPIEAASTERGAVTASPIKFPRGPLVILGASYAKGWNPTVQGMRVINKGIEGQQSFELLARFDQDVASNAPRAVIVWGFINDIFRAPQGGIDASLARTRDSFTKIVERARASGIEPILATEVTVRPKAGVMEALTSFVARMLGKQSYQDFINRHVLETNQWIRNFAANEKLLLLDLQPAVSDRTGLRRSEFATPDGSHISEAGYRALTDYASPVLQKHLSGQPR